MVLVVWYTNLKNEHLVQYQDKLKEIQDKKLLEVEELLKKEWFKKYFPNEIKDSKEVFGLLEDRNEKDLEVGKKKQKHQL